VIVGTKDQLFKKEITATELNWLVDTKKMLNK
jgi:hypothetical protein